MISTHLGVTARFATNLGWADLDRQLLAGNPVPIGILHRGHVSAPSGASLLYSKANLGPRWMVDGPGTGWGILA